MKFFNVILFCSILAVVLGANSVPSDRTETSSVKPKSHRCPNYCTALKNPICARSKKCIAIFGNPCKLDAYNCNRYKKDQFVPVDSKLCKKIPNNFYCW